MKRKQTFQIVEIAGDYMVIPNPGEPASGQTLALNGVAAFLLNAMQTEISREALLELLLREYRVSRETAQRDLDAVLDTFEKLGLIEN